MAKREKALPRIYGDPFQEEIGLPAPELAGESMDDIASFALGYFQEFAARVKERCSNEKLTGLQKRVDCFFLIYMVGEATRLVHDLAREFQPTFREVAEGMNQFPCMFPAHPERLRELQKLMWDDFNLGKRALLRLRPTPGRKTFSFKTWVNQLLAHYIYEAHYKVVVISQKKSERNFESVWLVQIQLTPEIARQLELLFEQSTSTNAKQWLDVIWQLLLIDIPNPEKHPQLRKLGEHPSRTERAHFGERKRTRSIKDAVGKNSKHQTAGYVRAAIKEALGKYLVRILRKKQSDK